MVRERICGQTPLPTTGQRLKRLESHFFVYKTRDIQAWRPKWGPRCGAAGGRPKGQVHEALCPTSHEAVRPPNATIKTYTDSTKVITLGFKLKQWIWEKRSQNARWRRRTQSSLRG